MFQFSRRSTSGLSVPSWLLYPGKVLLRRHVRESKYDPLVEEVDLLETNPQYAHVRLSNGRETTVSLRHLAPSSNNQIPDTLTGSLPREALDSSPPNEDVEAQESVTSPDECEATLGQQLPSNPEMSEEIQIPRRSQRNRNPPDRLKY